MTNAKIQMTNNKTGVLLFEFWGDHTHDIA
jgi:hypothetical protein